jgi:putative addiction module component (TIGR02574 family)
MSRSYEEIRDEVLALPVEKRGQLAEELYDSTLTDEERALEDEWDRRAEELISGKVKGISADEVIEEARAALKNARRVSSTR